MPDGLARLEERVTMLEERVGELHELVEGQEPWSHRKRLHVLENADRGVELARQALETYRRDRDRAANRWREWASFLLRAAAVGAALVAVVVR